MTVAICKNCGVGLCMLHLAEAQDTRPGGTEIGCSHVLPSAKDLEPSMRPGEVRDVERPLRHRETGETNTPGIRTDPRM